VAATDAAMELLEHVQHDFGEGPYLQAYAQDRAIGVEDLGAAPAWTRIAAVIGQLHVAGDLSVPVRLPGSRWEPWMCTPSNRGPGPPASSRR
jgi:hypothetical protein